MKTEKNPYVGARTFEPDESELFFGREREAQDLLSLVVSDRLVLFYAQSGAGKSSLINTKLIPGLVDEEDFKVFPVGRLRRDEVAGTKAGNVYIYNLATSLTKRNVDEEGLSKLSLSQYLAGLEYDAKDGYFYNENGPHDFFERAQKTSWKYVLIIDQFEELFTTYEEEWEKREDFFRQLAKAMDDFSCLWVVLVMREDYIAYMDPYRYLLPGKLRTRYYMQRLEKMRAVEAVEGPAKVFHRSYAPGAAKKLVSELSNIMVRMPDNTWEPQPGQYVEPVQLQVVCASLWAKLPEDVTTITAEDIKKYVGDLNQALGNFYGDRVKAVAEGKKAKEKGIKEREIRRWFEKELIIEGKRRNMVAQEPGGKSGGLDDEVVREFLGSLVREEKRGGGATFYELTHDRMVEPIVADNQIWKENWSPLQKQAALWDDQGRSENWLLSDQALMDVKTWAQEHPDEMTEIESDFLAACQRHQTQLDEQRLQQQRERELSKKIARTAQVSKRFAIVASILAVASIIAGFFAWQSQRDAKEAEKVALDAKADAQTRADVARARELASQADEKLNEELDLSMLLSAEAYQITNKNPDAKSPDAQNVLFNNAQRSTNLLGIFANPTNPANGFRFSPDGKYMAVTQQNQDEKSENLVLWNLDQDQPEKTILQTGKVDEFFFSQDSRYLIYLDSKGINRRNLETNTDEKAINLHVGKVAQVLFQPDGGNFVTVGENGEATVWDAAAGTMHEEQLDIPRDMIVFSPDNKRFAGYDASGVIVAGDILAPPDQYITMTVDPYSVTSMAFNQDGTQLAIADKDNNISFWDLAKNRELDITFTISLNAKIEKMVFKPNGDLVVFNPVDGVSILDQTGKATKTIAPAVGSPGFDDIVFSPDGANLAISDSSNQTSLYEAEGATLLEAPRNGTLSEFSADGKTMAIFDKGTNRIILVDAATGKLAGDPFPELDSQIASMAFSKDSLLLGAGTIDGGLTVWDVSSRTPKFALPAEPNSKPVSSLSFSPDNSQLIAGHSDSTLTIWTLSQNNAGTKELNYSGRISSIGLSPDGNFLYSKARNSVVLMNVKDFKPVVTVATDLPIDRIQFVANKRALAVFDKGGKVTIWNPSTGKTMPIDGSFVQFSPGEQIVETTDSEGNLKLWNTLNGNLIAPIAKEETAQFSVLEQFAVIKDSTGAISHVYNVDTGKVNDQMAGRQFIGFSSDDTLFLTSNKDSEFELWNMAEMSPVGKAFPAISSGSFVYRIGDFDGRYYYFSPDSKILVTANPTSTLLELRDTKTGTLLPGKTIEDNSVILINDDSTRLITNSYSTTLNTIWDLKKQEPLGQPLSGRLVQLSKDGKTAIMNDYSGMSLWDLDTAKRLAGPIEGSQVTLDEENKVMAVSNDYKVTLWDTVEMKQLGEPIMGAFIGLSTDGKFVAMRTPVAGHDAITVWNTKTSRQIGSPTLGLSSAPMGIATFNPGGTIKATRTPGSGGFGDFITLNQDYSDRYFDPQYSDTVIFSPHTNRLAIFNPSGSLTIWDTLSPSLPKNTVKDFDDHATSAALSPDGTVLVSAIENGIALWSPANSSTPTIIQNPHISEPTDVYLSPDGKTLITNDRRPTPTISLWNIEEAKRIGKPINEAFCGFSPDGRILITSLSASSYSYSLYTPFSFVSYCYNYSAVTAFTFWDISTGKKIGDSLNGDYSFSPNNEYIMLHSSNAPNFIISRIAQQNGSIDFEQVGDPIPGFLNRFGMDNETLITGENGMVKWWSIDPDKRTEPLATATGELWAATGDGNTALLREYNISTSKYTYHFWSIKDNRAFGKPVENIIDYYPALSSRNGFMAGATDKGVFTVWNLTSGKDFSISGTFSGFSADEKYVVSLDSSGKTTSIWNTATGKVAAELLKGSYWGFAGQGSEFVVCRDPEAGTYVFYKSEGGDRVGETTKADGLVFSPDGRIFASYLNQGSISLWQTASVQRYGERISGKFVGFSSDSRALVTTATDKDKTQISLWQTGDGSQIGKAFDYPGSLNGGRFSQEGKLLALFGNEGIYVWNLLEPDKALPRIADAGGDITHIVFSPDGTMMATVGNDGAIVWSVPLHLQLTSLLTGNTGRITDITFDGNSVVYLDADGSVIPSPITKATSPEKEDEQTIPGACEMALSPDGKRVAYITRKNKLEVVSVGGSNPTELDKDVPCYSALAFSPNGDSLAYGEGGRVYIYPIDENGKFGQLVEFTDSPVSSLTFILDNQDDQILAGNSSDGRIFIWDVTAHALLGTFNQSGTLGRSANGVMQIYLPQEERLIKLDLNADTWQASLKQWQADLCRKAGRTLTQDEWAQYFTAEGAYPDHPSCPMPPPPPSE